MQRNAKQQKRFVQINQAAHTELQRFTSLLVATSTLHTSKFDSRLRQTPKLNDAQLMQGSIRGIEIAILKSSLKGIKVIKVIFFLVQQELMKPIIAKKLRWYDCEVYLRSYKVMKSHIFFFRS